MVLTADPAAVRAPDGGGGMDDDGAGADVGGAWWRSAAACFSAERRAHAGADVLVERGRQRRGRDDAPEGAAVGAQEEGDGGERRPKRARRAPFLRDA